MKCFSHQMSWCYQKSWANARGSSARSLPRCPLSAEHWRDTLIFNVKLLYLLLYQLFFWVHLFWRGLDLRMIRLLLKVSTLLQIAFFVWAYLKINCVAEAELFQLSCMSGSASPPIISTVQTRRIWHTGHYRGQLWGRRCHVRPNVTNVKYI